MHSLISKKHMSVPEIEKVLNNKLFSKVTSVGINGGEPFLRNDIDECIEVIVRSLPLLKNIFIISNGYFSERITDSLQRIKKITSDHDVKLTVSFSVDGVKDMQDKMRGRKHAFENINKTLDIIALDPEAYCDYLNIVCTITKINVYNLPEVELWAQKRNLNVSYNIATINERIENHDRVNDFSIFTEKRAQLMAAEFFLAHYRKTGIEKYYGLYLFALSQKRYSDCSYKRNDGVTVTPNGDLCFCATHSKVLGNCLTEDAFALYHLNSKYHKEIRKHYCQSCSHYMYCLNSSGVKQLFNENNRYRHLSLYRRWRNR
jgi:MoaA/NifB/PqqE/SkfB family radical SAM enzyme